jgi:hypothetical protein
VFESRIISPEETALRRIDHFLRSVGCPYQGVAAYEQRQAWLMSAKCVDRISSGGARRRKRGGQESQQQHGQGCYRVDKRISRAYIKQECIHQP